MTLCMSHTYNKSSPDLINNGNERRKISEQYYKLQNMYECNLTNARAFKYIYINIFRAHI